MKLIKPVGDFTNSEFLLEKYLVFNQQLLRFAVSRTLRIALFSYTPVCPDKQSEIYNLSLLEINNHYQNKTNSLRMQLRCKQDFCEDKSSVQ